MSTDRNGDHDRDRVVRLLQEQVGAGRLTLTEFDRRAAHAYAAGTRAELDSLLADLPVPAPTPAAPRTSRPVIPAVLGFMAVALFAAGLLGAPTLLVAAGLCAAMACWHRPAAGSAVAADPATARPPGWSSRSRSLFRCG